MCEVGRNKKSLRGNVRNLSGSQRKGNYVVIDNSVIYILTWSTDNVKLKIGLINSTTSMVHRENFL